MNASRVIVEVAERRLPLLPERKSPIWQSYRLFQPQLRVAAVSISEKRGACRPYAKVPYAKNGTRLH
jgi:hypothetical protein